MTGLAVFHAIPGETSQQSLFGPSNSGSRLSGIPLLAQRCAVELLKRRNAVPFSPGGTGLVSYLSTGRIRTEQDLFLAFGSAIEDALRAIQSRESETDSDDDRLLSMNVDRLFVLPDEIAVILRITTRSRKSANYELPLRFNRG